MAPSGLKMVKTLFFDYAEYGLTNVSEMVLSLPNSRGSFLQVTGP